jgi:glycosyltransferase involved in cell wall biosynthesis
METYGARHVHAHFGSNSAEVVMLAHALGGPPYSFTVHGPTEFDKPKALHLAEKVARSAFTVAITSYCRSQLFRWVHHADWAKVKVVRCGLEPAYFETPPVPVPNNAKLVCLGRLVEQKGPLLLVEAAARLIKKGVNFELVLMGNGPMRAEVEKQVQALGIAANIRFTGAYGTKELMAEVLSSRGLILPSFAEGLPMVFMEAMALRRPVLSTYIAGHAELVRPGENGWLFPAGSVEAIADAMEDCLTRSPEDLTRMGLAGHAMAKALHSSDTLALELGALIDQSFAPVAPR